MTACGEGKGSKLLAVFANFSPFPPSLPPPSLPPLSLSPTLSGWEYSVESGIGAWVPYERNVHLSRRRRWVRLRKRDKDSKAVEKRKVFSLSYLSVLSLPPPPFPSPPPFLLLSLVLFSSSSFLPSLSSPSLLTVSPHLPLRLLTLAAQASEGTGGRLGVCPLG